MPVRLLTLLAVLAASSMCSAATPAETLNEARAKWDGARVGSYSFQIQRYCFCFGVNDHNPVQVRVRKGKVRSAQYIKASGSAEQRRLNDSALQATVPELFNLIENALKEGYDFVEVSYDGDYGYPRKISLKQSKDITDDDVTYAISQFEP